MIDCAREKRRAKRSDETRAMIRKRALELGQLRSDDVRKRILVVLQTIEQELVGSGGVYPHNKGMLSSAEVARRAGVHPTTLFSPKQRELGAEVKRWLGAIQAPTAVAQSLRRRKERERVAEWKQLYNRLAQSHRDTELALQEAHEELTAKQLELQALKRENERLMELLSSGVRGQVVGMPQVKK